MRRRTFLGAAGATIAAACVPGAGSTLAFGPPETTTIRIDPHFGCEGWTWFIEDLLREEGFTNVQITGIGKIHTGEADIGATFGNDLVHKIDAGLPYVVIGGTHTGCNQLWALPGINSIRDLRGKRIDVYSTKAGMDPVYGMWVSLLATFGIAPSEVRFRDLSQNPAPGAPADQAPLHGPPSPIIQNFLAGQSDAVLAYVDQGPALRANPKNPGHLIFDMMMDKPWSQYYCCLLTATRDYATAYPWATKRATRAVLRGIDIVVKDRKAAVDAAVRKGYTQDGKLLLEAIQDMPYPWREYDPADSLLYFALQLADAKLLKKTPRQIVAEGTDLAFFRQMQKELKT
jgi:NitT/TauT family transport system substrate-binding protein